ncbi:TPA: hypothetical protein NJ354_000448 [Vibrio parahaemolyticus]|nr:hypothetical protein [Vibrio parahaemolyticus]
MKINRQISLTLLLFPCSVFATDDKQQSVLDVGVEASLLPLVKTLTKPSGDAFTYFPSENIPQDMLEGKTQIAIMSRKWTDEEVSMFYQSKGYRPTQLFFMADAMVMINNKKSSVNTISFDSLEKRNHCISNLYVLENASSLDDMNTFTCQNEPVFLEQQQLKDRLDNDISSKAYIKYAEANYSNDWDDYKTLSIKNSNNETYAPSIEHIYSGRYPLSKVYYLYLDKYQSMSDSVKDSKLLELVTTEQDESAIRDSGYIELPLPLIERNRVKLGLQDASVPNGYK